MLSRLTLALCFLPLFCAPTLAADFIDNGDGTVKDNTTGLMWQQADDNTRRTWQQSLDYCNALTLAGHSDWRLPNIKELESIVDVTANYPAIDSVYFPGTHASGYWSSTSGAGHTDYAWLVYFGDGDVGSYYDKADDYYIRCVR